MAIMKLTAFNGGLKGKVAGTVFRQTAQGQVVQNLTVLIDAIAAGSKLTKADGGKNLDSRKAVTEVAPKWRDLTESQRAGWISNSAQFPFTNRFGEPYTPSGFQVFMSINTKLWMIGEDILLEVPVAGGPVNGPSFSATYDSVGFSFTIEDMVVPAGYKVNLYASRAMSKGRKPQDSMFTCISTFTTATVFPYDLGTNWTDQFGPAPASGNYWFYAECVKISNGAIGSRFYFHMEY